MADFMKVTRGLECCMNRTDKPDTVECRCNECSYKNTDIIGRRCLVELIEDARELLNEQKAIVPLYTTTSHPFNVGILYICGNCHCSLSRDADLFCRRCGKPINWEKGAKKYEGT